MTPKRRWAIVTTLKSTIKKVVNQLGYDIVRHKRLSQDPNNLSPHNSIKLQSEKIVDLESLGEIASTIPGMITTFSGSHLYSLCYFQNEQGDVVEIGSWQGRSSSYLARAVQASGNGKFYAVDHFKGNVGKEHFYVVNDHDLDDLQQGFVDNMKRIGVFDDMELLAMENEKAAELLQDRKIRFLFIDGDHTRAGLEKDIRLFFPMLVDGAIVAFDDFTRGFREVIAVLDEVLAKKQHSRVMTYRNTLILKYQSR